MSLELTSQNINPAQLTEIYLNPSSDVLGDLENLIGASVVKDYDEQIQWISAEIESVTTQKELIRGDKATLNALAAETTRDEIEFSNTATGDTVTASVVNISDEDWTLLEDFAEKLGLSEEFSKQSGTENNTTQKVVSLSVFDLLQERLDNQLTDLNSTSEMSMIHFQSLTDARKQSLLMLSNMISSDNQAKLSIIQNLKG